MVWCMVADRSVEKCVVKGVQSMSCQPLAFVCDVVEIESVSRGFVGNYGVVSEVVLGVHWDRCLTTVARCRWLYFALKLWGMGL